MKLVIEETENDCRITPARQVSGGILPLSLMSAT